MPTANDGSPLRALVLDGDPAMAGLLGEWLEGQGFNVFEQLPGSRCDLIVADIPQPRAGAPEFLKALAREHPRTPILALSSQFLPGVDAGGAGGQGALAQALGVDAVLRKPFSRDALAAAVKRLLARGA